VFSVLSYCDMGPSCLKIDDDDDDLSVYIFLSECTSRAKYDPARLLCVQCVLATCIHMYTGVDLVGGPYSRQSVRAFVSHNARRVACLLKPSMCTMASSQMEKIMMGYCIEPIQCQTVPGCPRSWSDGWRGRVAEAASSGLIV